MRKQLFCILGMTLLLSCAAGCTRDKTQAAQGAAWEWMKLVDSGKYAQSWDEAADLMKGNVAKEQWQEILNRNRAPLGTLLSRKLTTAEYKEAIPGAPAGQYVVLQYESSFQNKSSVVETATPVLDRDGRWRVSVYYIR
jgi:hypothetical protein